MAMTYMQSPHAGFLVAASPPTLLSIAVVLFVCVAGDWLHGASMSLKIRQPKQEQKEDRESIIF
jgi:hypothetical protein